MSFSEGITFFYNNNGCLEMLSWVRECSIDVFCECLLENGRDNMNHVEKSNVFITKPNWPVRPVTLSVMFEWLNMNTIEAASYNVNR